MNYNIGDIIVYRPFGGGERTVKVEEKEADIKNGLPGFSGKLLNDPQDGSHSIDGGVWGYDHQILRVIQSV